MCRCEAVFFRRSNPLADWEIASSSIFTSRYRVTKLVYYESYENVNLAIAREKQTKGGWRQKKIDLINDLNPERNDFYEEMLT